MTRSFFILILVGLLVSMLQSCNGVMYPNPRSNPFAPRMIQPIPSNGNVNALPQNSNFIQSYAKYKKSKVNSDKFGALVRIIEFEYEITDSLSIIPRITSGFDEGEMTGSMMILLDNYELTYKNDQIQTREYVEEVSFESSRSVPRTQQIYNPGSTNVIVNPDGTHSTVLTPATTSTVQNNVNEKRIRVENRSQIYNSVKYRLESEDADLILNSKSLVYVIQFQNCELSIYPTKEQLRILKRMIKMHFAPQSSK